MKKIMIFVVLIILCSCKAKQYNASADLFFEAAEAYALIEAQKEKARRLEKLAQEKAKKEKENYPFPDDPTLPQPEGDREVYCIRHGGSGGSDGGTFIGEPRPGGGTPPRQFKSCSVNGVNIPYHGVDNGAHSWWLMRKVVSGEGICIDTQGYSHKYDVPLNRTKKNQCN